NLYDIIELQLKDLHSNLTNKNNKLKVTKTAKDILIQDGSHREWGARPLRRAIQNEIENVISSKFLNSDFLEDGIITIKGKSGKLDFSQKLIQAKKEIKDKVS
ncbi:MAG: ATP-dependent Clp protease ATP-binding subunit ClpC, partial [Candidatus Marinimicrobia bacterium]|nr:ATP-dependent Clp protease ATP-binding subunit ClpC [Candidatus Neomarinimicrobiota bacterium]